MFSVPFLIHAVCSHRASCEHQSLSGSALLRTIEHKDFYLLSGKTLCAGNTRYLRFLVWSIRTQWCKTAHRNICRKKSRPRRMCFKREITGAQRKEFWLPLCPILKCGNTTGIFAQHLTQIFKIFQGIRVNQKCFEKAGKKKKGKGMDRGSMSA